MYDWTFGKHMPKLLHVPIVDVLHTFFTVFAVYFPSCTGIVAGANLSGDLKDPTSAIPKGTLLAVGTTYFSYILYAILSAGCSIRYASGIVAEYQYSEGLLNATMIEELNITRVIFSQTENFGFFHLREFFRALEIVRVEIQNVNMGWFKASKWLR